MEKRYDVFISYSTQDQKVVESIRNFLEREGYRCFVAYRDIPRGVVWATAITDAIDTSAMMLVVFSNAFNDSPQTDREIELASENRIPILTFRVDNVPMTGAKKYYLKNLNWIDAFPNPENYFGNLLDSVVRLIGPSSIVVDHAAEEEAERLAREETERKAREAAERERLAAQSIPPGTFPHGGNPVFTGVSEGRRNFEPDEPSTPPPPVVPNDKPTQKNKKPLWIALGAVAALVLLMVFLWLKKPADPDTKAFQDCQTGEDYRNYIADYGQDALHYAEALDSIQRFVADSAQRVQDSLAQAQAERAEDEAYRKCTTISRCNSYLKNYPNGRYADQVRAKKAELEQKQAPQKIRPTQNNPENPHQTVSQPQQQLQTQQQTTQNTPTVSNGGGSGSITGTVNGHEWVDLGLPSGTLWATCNVGANKPEGYGNYYAWGETTAKTSNTYSWNTYKYANGDYDKLTKYCSKSDYGNNGFTDNLTTLQSGDDPATANWGSEWQTPSNTQWEELLNNTTNQWTTRNGVQGRLFTSKKNVQTIFLPAAGYYWDSEFLEAGSGVNYWSRVFCSDNPYHAIFILFYSDGYYFYCTHRCSGRSIRPVRSAR